MYCGYNGDVLAYQISEIDVATAWQKKGSTRQEIEIFVRKEKWVQNGSDR